MLDDTGELRIHAERNIHKNVVQFYMMVDDGVLGMKKHSRAFVSALTFKNIDPDAEVSEYNSEIVPAFSLSYDSAQKLMDELWYCGISPSKPETDTGAFGAQGAHLDDMRKIAFELIGLKK